MKKLNIYPLVQVLLICIFLLTNNSLWGQKTVTFKVKMPSAEGYDLVGVRGSIAPLSWEETYPLKPTEEAGVYEATITLNSTEKHPTLQYKYVYGEAPKWELPENRSIVLKTAMTKLPIQEWNVYSRMTAAEVAALTFTRKELLEDFAIMKKAYLTLHPGLYRYNTKKTMAEHLQALEDSFYDGMPLAEVYKAFSLFTATIKCGHTYANFFNQSRTVKEVVHYQANKVPFNFRWIDSRMIVTASVDSNLPQGSEVLSINGVAVSEILSTLMTITKGDGSNDGQRIKDLELTSISEFEGFDIFFPLYYQPVDGKYTIKAKDILTQKVFDTSVTATTIADRKKQLLEQFPNMPMTHDDLWQFRLLDEETAHLYVGSFVTWHMTINWKKFLKESFQTMKDKNIQNLILDIRGNGGGMDNVITEIGKYVVKSDVTVENSRSQTAYQKMPEDLDPYLTTWDNKYKDFGNKVSLIEPGRYEYKSKKGKTDVVKASNNPLTFNGDVYLLANEVNSSATFYMTRLFKDGKIGTVVGQTTGGNQKGINGGAMFFMNLPNSKVELDIPLFATFPYTEKPDGGVEPDVFVQPNVEDIVRGIDTEIEAVQTLISTKKKQSVNTNLATPVLTDIQGDYKGTLTYLNYGDDKSRYTLKATLKATKVQHGVKYKVIFEEKNKNGKNIIHSSNLILSNNEMTLEHLGSKWKVKQSDVVDGVRMIVAERSGKDNNRKADFRLTVKVQSANQITWTKEVCYKGTDTYFVRNEHRFSR